uniref:Protein AAR2 homolog n=1 Tax=Heterorhabditis bacteriophora TaxID=37862 RepID=A0A1I7XUN4_HETBA
MALNILTCLKNGEDLPREVVNYMYETGGFLILKDFPEGHEFGIDYKSWNVGPKFMGIKMIPPGVHFIYCSMNKAPRIGFFHDFKSREVVVKKWDKRKEDISDEEIDHDELIRYQTNLKNMDSMLGPYPYENYRSWYALTDFITGDSLNRLNPLKGRISAQAELVSLETQLMEDQELNAGVGCSNSVDRDHPKRTRFVDHNGLPIMKIREGYEIRFQSIPQLVVNSNRSGIDYSDRLDQLISQLGGDWKQLLAEVQFAFACFLIGQVLFFQLKECPSDFFVDIVSRDNFLTTTLSMLFANIRDADVISADLKKKSLQFKNYLTKQFKWDFECD